MSDPWLSWQAATCMPDHCFCEAVRFGDLIRQPSNTWSNLSFVLVAIVLILQVRSEAGANNNLIRHKELSYLYALSCLLVGLGSFFFHASLTFVGQWVDVLGMYLAVTFFSLYNFLRIYQWKIRSVFLLFALSNAILGYVLYAQAWSRRYLFGIFVFLLLASILYSHKKIKSVLEPKYLYLAISTFIAGVTIWILDLLKVVCDPYFIVQGHSIWHFLTALSSYFVFKYYWSEKEFL